MVMHGYHELHMQLARELRGQGWSQMNIAAMLGTTQSTISRQYQKPVTTLPGSADELAVDGWAKEIAGGLLSVGQNEELLRQRFIVEFQFTETRFYVSIKHSQASISKLIKTNMHSFVALSGRLVGLMHERLCLSCQTLA